MGIPVKTMEEQEGRYEAIWTDDIFAGAGA